MIQKNQRLRLSCERLGSELEGVCLNEGMPVFVPGVLPGEEADVLCVKVQPRYAFGRLMVCSLLRPTVSIRPARSMTAVAVAAASTCATRPPLPPSARRYSTA